MKKAFALMAFLVCAGMVSAGSPRAAEASELAALQSQVAELADTVRQLTQTVQKQQIEIAELKQTRIPGPSGPAPVSSAGRTLQGKWNPDIGVVADTVLKLDSPKEDAEGADRLSVRELEIVFGSNVDPYSRLDMTLAIADFKEMEIEEAYLTRFGLPFETTARIGRFRQALGKANPAHRDTLETVDEPLVIQRWFGVEGLHKTGADLTKMIDLPWDVTHELRIGAFEGGNGEEGTAFGTARRDPTLYAHLKNYLDLNGSTGLEVGLNYLAGSKDDDEQFEVNIIGLDGTLIHRLNPDQRIKLQGETYFMDRADTEFENTLWGSYALFDFRFQPQWAAGFRYDTVELVDTAAGGSDEGYSGYLTFYQSEFARWRIQLSHFDLANGKDDDQVLLQGTFAIGEHKHKLQ